MNIFYNNMKILASRDAFGGSATLCACDRVPPL